MPLIGGASAIFMLAIAFDVSGFAPATQAEQNAPASEREFGTRHRDGRSCCHLLRAGHSIGWMA